MSNIKIKTISINNFKGIKNLEIAFSDKETNIKGANASGKSSVMDAFTWLLFNKDSQDRKDFDIKNTVDLELNRQDHEVTGVLDIDGRHETLKHIYREKWVKKQGSQKSEMSGHEHLYLWNDVPMQAGEYKAKVDNILNEGVFKLLTNALYFNSLKWQERRSIIEGLAGTIADSEIIEKLVTVENANQYVNLVNILNSGKKIEEYQKEISSKKKLIKTSLDEISPRIDENIKQLPEDIDLASVDLQIQNLNSEILKIDNSMADRSKASQSIFNDIQAKQSKVHSLITESKNISNRLWQNIQFSQNEKSSKLITLKAKVDTIQESITSKKTLIDSRKQTKVRIDQEMEELRLGWAKDKAREFVYDESKFACPTCNRDFETDDIESAKNVMKENFDNETARLLQIVNEKGAKLKQEKESNDSLIELIGGQLERLEQELEEALKEYNPTNQLPIENIEEDHKKTLAENLEYQAIIKQADSLQKELDSTEKPEVNLADLQETKAALTMQIDSLKTQLIARDRRKSILERIESLKSDESKLSGELAQLEGIEFTISEFLKSKINLVEAKTNGLFKYVSFKMFEILLNGGYEPTCVTMYKGVPWDTLNTAARINAGMDIINTLSKFHEVTAPIFLDNRESTTHVIETESQLINLIVSPEHSSLIIE